MLPSILTRAGIGISRVLDLFPDTDEWVIVAPGHEAPLKSIRWLYGTQEEKEAAPVYERRRGLRAGSAQITPGAGQLTLSGRRRSRSRRPARSCRRRRSPV
jgi:hypothetical protein